MEDMKLKCLLQDPDDYARAFSVYSKYSTKHETMATWADTVFPREVVETLANNFSDHDKPLRILGVGSGTGITDFKWIENLSKRFPSIVNTVVEPSGDHILEYKKQATTKDYDCSGWVWHQKTWDEFAKVRSVENVKFHFISAVHSMYYVDDLETALMDMMGCLEDGGILLVVMIAEHNGFSRLWRRFPMLPGTNVSQDNTGTMQDILKKNGLGFGVFPRESSVDITSCYEKGNEDGKLVADFIAHVVNLHATAPPAFVEEVMAYMGGPECSYKNGDRTLFRNDWDAILVTKKPTT